MDPKWGAGIQKIESEIRNWFSKLFYSRDEKKMVASPFAILKGGRDEQRYVLLHWEKAARFSKIASRSKGIQKQ